MTWLQKLKREWKTATAATVGAIVSGYDALQQSGADIAPLIPEGFQKYWPLFICILMLILRKWTEPTVTVTETKVTETTEVKDA